MQSLKGSKEGSRVSHQKKGLARRAFNTWLMSATALAALGSTRASAGTVSGDVVDDSKRPHIAVIGAGIIGSSIAYHLVKQGAQVTLIDRSTVGGATSHGTFAWINATWAKQPRHYHSFNQLGIEAWRRLQEELGLPIAWGGSLEWFTSEARQRRLVQDIAEQQKWGEPAVMVGVTDARDIEPNANFGDAQQIAYSPRDGAVDARLASQRMVSAAKNLGLTLLEDCAVDKVRTANDGRSVLETDLGELSVDRYVVATGADPSATMALAGIEIPQRSTPGVIVITEPLPRMLNTIFVAPGVHVHQRPDGRLVLGEQDGAPETPAHDQRLASFPTRFPTKEIAQEHADRLLSTARKFIPSLPDAIKLEEVVIGWRPLPLDGHPVIGPSPVAPNSYIAIMHSGVSLAPIVGELVALELIENLERPELSPYRATRDFRRIQRY